MNKQCAIFCVLCFLLVFIGCSGHTVSKSSEDLNAETYTSRGIQAYTEMKLHRANDLFSRALLLYQGLDNQQGIMLSYINLAEVALSADKLTISKKYLGLATRLLEKPEFKKYQSHIILLSAQQAIQQNKVVQAERLLQPILPMFEGDNVKGEVETIQMAAVANRTKIAFMRGLDEAFWVLRYANILKKAEGKNAALEARLLRFQAEMLEKQGKNRMAVSYLKQALVLYKSVVLKPGIAVTLKELGQLNMRLNHWQLARDYLIRAIDVYQGINRVDKELVVLESLMIVEKRLGHTENSQQLNGWLLKQKNEKPVEID